MPANGLQVFFYESFPIECLDFIHVSISGGSPGGMPEEEFDRLVKSIKTQGLINPILVEDDNTRLKVQLGNNRIWARKKLGHDTIKTILITKNSKPAPLPGFLPIPLHQFDATMAIIHPGDKLYEKSPYVRNIRGAFRQTNDPAEWTHTMNSTE